MACRSLRLSRANCMISNIEKTNYMTKMCFSFLATLGTIQRQPIALKFEKVQIVSLLIAVNFFFCLKKLPKWPPTSYLTMTCFSLCHILLLTFCTWNTKCWLSGRKMMMLEEKKQAKKKGASQCRFREKNCKASVEYSLCQLYSAYFIAYIQLNPTFSST